METKIKYVVKIYNKDGLEIGQKPNKKWTVLTLTEFRGNANLEAPFEEGDKIEILREYKEEDDDRIRRSPIDGRE